MKRLASGKVKPGQGGEIDELQELTCRICFDLLENPQVTECMHRFCKKCINQHLRQFEKKQHMCPLCNKQIKTTRSVKPDLVVANLISALYPNRERSSSEENLINNNSLSDVIRDAAAKHTEQLKKMRESQIQTVMKQYPGWSLASAEDQPYPTGANIPQRTSGRRAAQLNAQEDGISSPPFTKTAAYMAIARTAAAAAAAAADQSSVSTASAMPATKKMGAPQYDTSEYDSFRATDVLGGMKMFSIPPRYEGKVAAFAENARDRTMDAIVLPYVHGASTDERSNVPEMYFYCVPPVQVKFRRHPEDAVSGRLETGFVSMAADTPTHLIKRAIAEKLVRAPGSKEREVAVVETREIGGGGRASSSSSSSSSSSRLSPGETAVHKVCNAMTLEVPVPTRGKCGSGLPLAGFRFHKLKDPDMSITQVLSWYERQMEAFGDDGDRYDLLLCYKVTYEGVN